MTEEKANRWKYATSSDGPMRLMESSVRAKVEDPIDAMRRKLTRIESAVWDGDQSQARRLTASLKHDIEDIEEGVKGASETCEESS